MRKVTFINYNTATPARKWRIIFTAAIMTAISASSALAQKKTNTERVDSIVALLPRLNDEGKLKALSTLIDLTPDIGQMPYAYMLLEEARRQKNVEWEGKAMKMLTLSYYHRHDTDSVFIVGEETIRFLRKHKLYDDLFSIHGELVKRYVGMDQTLTALRYAEEAYAEAKELQDGMCMAYMLSAIGHIHYSVDQYEEAARYYTESIALAASRRQANPTFIINHYDFLAILYAGINCPKETLRYADSIRVEFDRLLQDNVEFNSQFFLYNIEYHYAIAYADLKQPEQSLEAIRRAEALFDPQWNEATSNTAIMNDCMYAAYYFAAGAYDKALEHYAAILRFNENIGYEAGILFSNKLIAEVYAEKGDHTTAAEMYRNILQGKEKLNNEQFYAQINELRTIYELDKAELETERHRAALHRQRFIAAVLALACLAMMLIMGLTVWSRRKIAKKNYGLYRQIKEQDRLAEELEAERKKNRELRLLVNPTTDDVQDRDEENNYKLFFDRFAMQMNEQKLFTDPEIKRKDMAQLAGLSDRALHDCIKKSTGMSFTEYINSRRLTYSRELLSKMNDKITIDAVAFDAGFNSRTTFYRLFNEKYGLTPKQFREFVKS